MSQSALGGLKMTLCSKIKENLRPHKASVDTNGHGSIVHNTPNAEITARSIDRKHMWDTQTME
jgi:hypothetical protein